MHSLYTSWLSVKISSLTKDWLLRNLCQQLTHFLMREPGTAVNMDHYFEKKLWKFSFYLMFYLLQLEFQVKSCFFGFLLRRCTGTLRALDDLTLFNMGSMRTYFTWGAYGPLNFFLNYKALMEVIWHVISPTLDLSKNTYLVPRALVKICWRQHFWHNVSGISENWVVSEEKLMFLGKKLFNCIISLNCT